MELSHHTSLKKLKCLIIKNLGNRDGFFFLPKLDFLGVEQSKSLQGVKHRTEDVKIFWKKRVGERKEDEEEEDEEEEKNLFYLFLLIRFQKPIRPFLSGSRRRRRFHWCQPNLLFLPL